jgi:hypothetical protein
MRRFFRVKRDLTGNLPVPPAVYPDMMAPVVRTAPDGERELIMMRWGFPPPPNLGNVKPRAYLGIRRRFARACLGCPRDFIGWLELLSGSNRGCFRNRCDLWPNRKALRRTSRRCRGCTALFPSSGSSGKQALGSRAPAPYLNVLCRAAKSHASDTATPIHSLLSIFSPRRLSFPC